MLPQKHIEALMWDSDKLKTAKSIKTTCTGKQHPEGGEGRDLEVFYEQQIPEDVPDFCL